MSKESFSGKGPWQGALGIPDTQSVALGYGSPIGGLWNLNIFQLFC